jgi:DNA-directed RNA polymerase specialized sigma24 family protein
MVLGVTQGAVLTRLFRARQRLRQLMGMDGPGTAQDPAAEDEA